MAGHPGRDRTYWNLSRHFYWPRMGRSRDVKAFVRSCESCQRNKSRKNQGWSSSTAPDSWLSVGSYQYGLHCRSTANWFGLQCNLHIRRPINRICSSHTYNVKCWRKRSGPIVYQLHLSSPWPEQIHSIGSRPKVHVRIPSRSIHNLRNSTLSQHRQSSTDQWPYWTD